VIGAQALPDWFEGFRGPFLKGENVIPSDHQADLILAEFERSGGEFIAMQDDIEIVFVSVQLLPLGVVQDIFLGQRMQRENLADGRQVGRTVCAIDVGPARGELAGLGRESLGARQLKFLQAAFVIVDDRKRGLAGFYLADMDQCARWQACLFGAQFAGFVHWLAIRLMTWAAAAMPNTEVTQTDEPKPAQFRPAGPEAVSQALPGVG